MKKLLITMVLLVATNFYGYSQKVYNLDKQKDSITYKPSGDFAIYKGNKHIVYVSQNGKYFILVTSKSGKQYKKYLKTA